MLYLKQSTASQSVLLGPFVDSTDGATAETGLTIANTDIRLSKNGGNMAAKNSGGGTHDENGWYTITLDATDTNTVGRLQVSCVVSGALPVFAEFQVVEEAIYDAWFASGATAPATASALATVDNNVDAILADTNELQTDDIPGTLATIAAYLDTEVAAILEDTGTTIPATLSTIAGYIDTEVAAIKAVTDNLPDSGALTSLATAAQATAIEADTQNIQSRLPTSLSNGAIDANITRVNDTAVTGDGAEGTEWGPA